MWPKIVVQLAAPCIYKGCTVCGCVDFFVCACVGVFCQMTNVQFENVKEFRVDMLFENLLHLALHCQFTTAARHCCHTLAPLQPQSPSMAHATATFVAALSLATRVPKRSSLRVGEAPLLCPLLLLPCYCCCRQFAVIVAPRLEGTVNLSGMFARGSINYRITLYTSMTRFWNIPWR